MASRALKRRMLRRIPMLRNFPIHELQDVQSRLVSRSYQAGEVLWRTKGPLRFSGYIQSGELELEYRVDGFLVRTVRLRTGDPLPTRLLRDRRAHGMVIARAITDVQLRILPESQWPKDSTTVARVRGASCLWPLLLLLIVLAVARDDIARITSGVLYLSAEPANYVAQQPPPSMSLLKTAQRVEPGAAFIYNEEGYRSFLQGQQADAIAAFSAAIERDPASAPALNNAGIVYFSKGDLPQAIHYLQQAVSQDPDNMILHYNLGILLVRVQDSSDALLAFRKASFIDPQAVAPLLQEASLYLQMGAYVEAEQRARSALQLDASLASAHTLLGTALYGQGRETEALTSFTQARTLQPGNRTAAFYEALILGHLKQYDAALPILQELLVSSADEAESERILAEINALDRLQTERVAIEH